MYVFIHIYIYTYMLRIIIKFGILIGKGFDWLILIINYIIYKNLIYENERMNVEDKYIYLHINIYI